MVPVYSPLTESEAAVISALLEAYDIPFFIRGGAFSKLYPGLPIKDYNVQTFMVPADSYELARELLAEFITPDPQETTADVPQRSPWRTVRVLFEALCFGWVVTGSRWNKKGR
jgi:hypothetical protein